MTVPSPEPTREPDAWMDLLALQTAVFAYLDARDTSPGSDARDALLTALGASSAAIAWRGPEHPAPAVAPAARPPVGQDGFCTCRGHALTPAAYERMRDCGVAQHRALAVSRSEAYARYVAGESS